MIRKVDVCILFRNFCLVSTTVRKVSHWLDIVENTGLRFLSIDFYCVIAVAASDVCQFVRQIKLYYYDTVIERYIESRLEVHRTKTLAEATEIAWKVFIAVLCTLKSSSTRYV